MEVGRGGEADSGWDLEAAGRGGSGLPAVVCGRRAHGGKRAAVPGSCGADDASMERPHGGSVAHGGPLGWRGSRRIRTSRPWP
jgi:hypothetical protein